MSTGSEQGSYFSPITYNICRMNDIYFKNGTRPTK